MGFSWLLLPDRSARTGCADPRYHTFHQKDQGLSAVDAAACQGRLQSSRITAVPKKKRRTEATSRNKGAAALRAYMKAHNLTQFQLAEKLECTRPHVAMLLAGSPPSLSVAVRIEKTLGIPCRDWTEPMTPPASEKRSRAAAA